MEHLAPVFFVYGLAFFAMGLAIALESRRPSDLILSRSLRYLAAFGLLHGVVEWIDMWLLLAATGQTAIFPVRILRLILFAASTVALAQFGADGIVSIRPTVAPLRWLPLALVGFWAINWAIFSQAGLVTADVWLRYLLYLPGSLLAAAGFWLEGRRLNGIGYPSIAADCRRTALAFVGNAVMAGLIVPAAPFFPASVLNYDRFASAVGVPPQLFRAGLAVLIAIFTLRVLRVFELAANRQLSEETEARLAAQQAALSAVQQAQAAAEEWSRTLEDRVGARTADLERRTRELGALNAIATTVTSSLDLQEILGATVDRVLDLIGGEGGGITLLPTAPGEPEISVSRGPAASDIPRARGFEAGVTATGQAAFPEAGATRPFITVPLRAKGRLLGELTVLGRPGGRYDASEVELVSTVAQQVGVAVENARLFQETATRRREAEALYSLGTEITVLSDVGRLLDLVVASARELLGADAAMLSLLEESRGRLIIKAASGLRSEAMMGVELASGRGIAGQVVLTGRPLVVEDYLANPRITHELDGIVRQEGLHAHIGVPISARGRTLGCLAVAFRRVRSTIDDDVRLLTRMANQAAIAIENARLYEQVQSLAILQERDRLGREMHDSLGQSLGVLNLKAKLVEDLVAAGRTREAADELAQIRQTIREAYEEVRHAILGLRASGGEDLEAALRVQITRFRDQTKLPVAFNVQTPLPPLPALTAVQVERIVQEALTNVRKHAHASAVTVALGVASGRLVVRIADDGRGFDVTAVQAAAEARFGLETMRERAESAGGTLEITSAPRRGTTIALSVPIT